MRYELLEPARNLDEALDTLTKVFAPLYTQSWVKEKAAAHEDAPFDMNVGVFANMWFSKALKLIIAYDGEHPVGYLMGMVFRPLPYQAQVFQIEDWYADGKQDVADGLFNYAREAAKFLGTDEIWVSHSEKELYPLLGGDWQITGKTVIDRYVRR
ncbi:MAG: hypothetical protein HDQ88_05665 [Clostridia bacterium]|nr:hypothetical protein [Clostridia bacterium]